MNNELFDLWIERANAVPPANFADRVMNAVHSEPLPSSQDVQVPLLSSPAMRAGACVLACLACLYRMAAVIAVFFVQ